jgi:hypothetical protein
VLLIQDDVVFSDRAEVELSSTSVVNIVWHLRRRPRFGCGGAATTDSLEANSTIALLKQLMVFAY